MTSYSCGRRSSKRFKDNDETGALQKFVTHSIAHFKCPLSLGIIVDPVSPGDGHIYEAASWNEYVERQRNEHPHIVYSPMTREPINMEMVFDKMPKPFTNNIMETVFQAANVLSPTDSMMSDVEDWVSRYIYKEKKKVCLS